MRSSKKLNINISFEKENSFNSNLRVINKRKLE